MPSDFYETNPDPVNLYQGDILKDYDIIILPDRIASSPIQPTDQTLSGTALLEVKRRTTNIMILSHSCDIARREFVAVCPVFPIIENQRNDIKNGRTNYRFWLPAKPGVMEESYADLVIINTIKKDNLLITDRIASLTDRYRSNFTHRISQYFCRPIQVQEPQE